MFITSFILIGERFTYYVLSVVMQCTGLSYVFNIVHVLNAVWCTTSMLCESYTTTACHAGFTIHLGNNKCVLLLRPYVVTLFCLRYDVITTRSRITAVNTYIKFMFCLCLVNCFPIKRL